jgi:hypothetical protein
MGEEGFTPIRVKKGTARTLRLMGRKGETYDDVIQWLLRNSRKRKLKPDEE